ncbi:hypothetical protein HFD98_25565 [Pseudomonas sp. EKM23D]|uniref:hypothetical protein n=1 Tax=Pseudomonas sp. EKM23D TaxID=2708062 RepID=UPI00142D788A|nr:hypothetical protein [Pseudomonas sp. EKM23D]KAF6686952.1 hypothetical protein HFD98_25565 [Pseudomonas sp. EKM23D]
MESISPSVWFPVVTLVIGLLLKAVFDSWTENRKAGFDRESRIEKRKEVLLLQRIDLQRKALGELQVSIADMMRATKLVQIADVADFRQTSIWGKASTPESVKEAVRESFRAVSLMKVRVSDDAVREMVGKLSSLCVKVTMAKSEDDSDADWLAASLLYIDSNDKIGEVLRSLEHQEQALLS